MPYKIKSVVLTLKFLSNLILLRNFGNVIFIIFTLNTVTISTFYFSKVSELFTCSSKSILDFRLSSTRLLINRFLIKKNEYSIRKSFVLGIKDASFVRLIVQM